MLLGGIAGIYAAPRFSAKTLILGMSSPLRRKNKKQNFVKLEMFVRAVCVAVWHTGVGIKKSGCRVNWACHLVSQNIIAVALRTAAFGR